MGVPLRSGWEESSRGCLFPGYPRMPGPRAPPPHATPNTPHLPHPPTRACFLHIPLRGSGVSALKHTPSPPARLWMNYMSQHAPPTTGSGGGAALPANSFASGELWLARCTAAVVNGNRGFEGCVSWTAGGGSRKSAEVT